jgi:hypothetical protein
MLLDINEIDTMRLVNLACFWCATALVYKSLIVCARFTLRRLIEPGK